MDMGKLLSLLEHACPTRRPNMSAMDMISLAMGVLRSDILPLKL